MFIIGGRCQCPAAHPHALEVDDRFGKHRKRRRHNTMGPAGKPLGFGNFQLVVDPAVKGIEFPAVRVVGGNKDILRTIDTVEILKPPGIALKNRHAGA